MPDLGTKYECAECGTKFYDLGKPEPLCPKCGTDARQHQDKRAPVESRPRYVAPPAAPAAAEEEVEEDIAAEIVEDDEEILVEPGDAEEEDDDDDE